MAEKAVATPPQGIVTLMFTDVEGSSRRWEEHHDRFGQALQLHDRIIRDSIARHGGYEVKTVGDAFMVAFADPSEAIRCAAEIQLAFAEFADSEPLWQAVGGVRIRIGLHTGEPIFRENDYFGPPVNRAARISDAGHGGMTVVSGATARLAANLSDEISLQDQGIHRLKDLGQPERLYLLQHPGIPDRAFASLRTLEAMPHNFPAQVTSFVGRARELEELTEILRKPQNRLLTATGPGGTGKTRLAMQVAVDRLQDFPGGVWFVELASIREDHAVGAAIALALNVQLSPNSDPARQVAEFLKPRRCLLLLDNFEQVANAAPLVSDLLRECPGLTVFVTSRELLHLSGEHEYPVEPLSVPPSGVSASGLMQYEGVQLFVERCRTLRPDFELTAGSGPVIGEIVRQLDGIPLAIELAAARVRGMTPAQILQRLSRRFDLLASGQRDLPERQRALRSTIDWSYELLTEDERALFGELAVFSGGFFIEAAEEVCSVNGVWDLLFSLRDKSLLKTDEVAGEQRYTMLAMLREYALEKLQATGSHDGLRDRHAACYLRTAAELGAKLEGSAEAERAMLLMTVDIDNMRAGMDWVSSRGDQGNTIEYGKALARFFLHRGLYTEGDARLLVAENASRQANHPRDLALILHQRGRLAWKRGDIPATQALVQETYEISKIEGDRQRQIAALVLLGMVSWGNGSYALARQQWEEALGEARATGETRYEAVLLSNLALVAAEQNELETAATLFSDSLARHQRNNDQVSIAYTLMNSSDVLRRQGRLEESLERLTESQHLFTQLGHKHEMALVRVRVAEIQLSLGKSELAEVNAVEGLRVSEEIGDRWGELAGATLLGRICGEHGALSDALSHYRRALEIANTLGDRKHVGDILRNAAGSFELAGQHSRAIRACRCALSHYPESRPGERAEVEALLAKLGERADTEPAGDVESPESLLEN